jgi:hypothetical protein
MALGVFYWSIDLRVNAGEIKVNADKFSERIASIVLGPLGCLVSFAQLPSAVKSLGINHSGGIDVGFGDVDLCDGGVDGIRHPGGLWGASSGFCVLAATAPACTGEDPRGSCGQ